MAEDDLENGEDAEANGEDAGRARDGDVGAGDNLGHSSPGTDGRNQEGAVLGLGVRDAGVGSGEQDEQTGRKPNGDEGSDSLGDELLVGRCAEQETGTEIGRQSRGNVSSAGGETGGDEVDLLGVLDGVTGAGGGTTDNKLSGLGSSSKRCLISDTTDLDGEEREQEGENQGEDGDTNVDLPLQSHDDASQDDGREETNNPDPGLDLLLGSRGVLDSIGLALLFCLCVLCEEFDALALLHRGLVDGEAD